MQFEELHTERLILRKIVPESYPFLFSTMNDEEIMDFFGLTTNEQLDREKNKYKEGMTTFRITTASFLLIEKATGKTIGGCGYHNWYPSHRRAEIGYDLRLDEHKQKGYMTEALKAVLDYGFNKMDLHRVEGLAAPDNVPSLALLKRFGFTYEGTLREHYNVDGVMEDSVMYSLLKHEFLNK